MLVWSKLGDSLRPTVTPNRVVCIRDHRCNKMTQFKAPLRRVSVVPLFLERSTYLMALHQAFIQNMTFSAKSCIALLGSRESRMQIEYAMFETLQSKLRRVHGRLSRCARLGNTWLVGRREGISMNQGMPRCSPLYLP